MQKEIIRYKNDLNVIEVRKQKAIKTIESIQLHNDELSKRIEHMQHQNEILNNKQTILEDINSEKRAQIRENKRLNIVLKESNEASNSLGKENQCMKSTLCSLNKELSDMKRKISMYQNDNELREKAQQITQALSVLQKELNIPFSDPKQLIQVVLSECFPSV